VDLAEAVIVEVVEAEAEVGGGIELEPGDSLCPLPPSDSDTDTLLFSLNSCSIVTRI
jgi:hypothetical protein